MKLWSWKNWKWVKAHHFLEGHKKVSTKQLSLWSDLEGMFKCNLTTPCVLRGLLSNLKIHCIITYVVTNCLHFAYLLTTRKIDLDIFCYFLLVIFLYYVFYPIIREFSYLSHLKWYIHLSFCLDPTCLIPSLFTLYSYCLTWMKVLL